MCACFCVCVNLRVCDTAWQTLPSPLKANVGFHPIDTNRSSDLPCIDMKHKMTNLSAVICLSVSSSEKRLFKKNKKKNMHICRSGRHNPVKLSKALLYVEQQQQKTMSGFHEHLLVAIKLNIKKINRDVCRSGDDIFN